jgi:hypothetical protein
MTAAGFCRSGGTLLGVPVAVGCEPGCECSVRSPLALQWALRVFAPLIGLGVSAFLADQGGAPPSPWCQRLGVQGSLPDSTPAVCSYSPMHTQAQKISGEAMQGAGGGRLFTCLGAATVGLSASRVSAEAGVVCWSQCGRQRDSRRSNGASRLETDLCGREGRWSWISMRNRSVVVV